ncbi:hypothetical protein HDU93_009053 [Gonapodya sp. JEL0774]|nr:hypothetical protein HDU93_009053 [Gonapodya sp. JEL0774]
MLREEDVAAQFLGFRKNFVKIFDMQGYKIFVAGESYAGLYCPYIASALIHRKDTTYHDISGILLYNLEIADWEIQTLVTAKAFTGYCGVLSPFNDTFRKAIRVDKCAHTSYVNKYLVYPPARRQPNTLPSIDSTAAMESECWSIYDETLKVAALINPCLDRYEVAAAPCPLLHDPLGFPRSFNYLPGESKIYFARADVQAAIRAPEINGKECSHGILISDTSDGSIINVLPNVIDRTKNVIISSGAVDTRKMTSDTLLAI